jgi:hypothetical protein
MIGITWAAMPREIIQGSLFVINEHRGQVDT